MQPFRSWASTAPIGVYLSTTICGGAHFDLCVVTIDHLTRHVSCECRVSGGNEEVLVRHFFATTGWPSTLSTADYGAFVGNVLARKRSALERAVMEGDLPLRPGLEA